MGLGKVLTIASGKGGVGKSTTVSNIAHFLAWSGYKTLIIDMDIGLRTLDFILGVPQKELKYDIIQLLNNEISIDETIIKVSSNKDLYFIPASIDGDKELLEISKIDVLIKKLKTQFDYIVIDSPAGIETGFLSSVYFADDLILVVSPDIFSLKDADQVINILNEENRSINTSFIVNKFIPEFSKTDDSFNIVNIQKKLAIPLLGIVEFDPKVIKTTDIGRPICLYQKTKAGKEFRNIVQRYLGKKIPLPEYSFFDKLKELFFYKI